MEPFAGGAAILFARAPSSVEVLNDINGDIANLYRCVQNHLEELVRQFKWLLVSRDQFNRFKAQPPELLTDIQRAARFYFLQKTAFGARVSGQSFGVSASQPPRLNLLRLEEDMSAAHVRLSRVTIENLDWRACMQRYDRSDSFFFLDPPYFETEGYGVDFGIGEYEKLWEQMSNSKGMCVLTINDHPAMRQIFSGFKVKVVDIKYTIGAGGPAPRKELIYHNR